MKLEFNKRYTTIAIYVFLVLAATLLFWRVISQIRYFQTITTMILGLLRPFVYAFGIAYLLNPILKQIERYGFGWMSRGKLRRGLAILITYLFAAGLITLFSLIVLPRLIDSLTGLANYMFSFLNSWESWLPEILRLLPEVDLNATIVDSLQRSAETIVRTAYELLSQYVIPWTRNVSTGVASGLLNVVVGIIISVYMLMDKERYCAGIKRIAYATCPKKKADWLLELVSDANRIFGGFISGKIIDSIIIGFLCFFGMRMLDIPNPLLVSVIVGVTNVIPYFGPFIGAIPSFFIILIENPLKSLIFLLFVLILQQFDGNILGPKILGDSTGLSAFWVIFSIMLFGGLYGFTGMFLGVPCFSVILMLITRLIHTGLRKRQMPEALEEYCSPGAPLLFSKNADQKNKEKKRTMAHKVAQVIQKKDSSDSEPKD